MTEAGVAAVLPVALASAAHLHLLTDDQRARQARLRAALAAPRALALAALFLWPRGMWSGGCC